MLKNPKTNNSAQSSSNSAALRRVQQNVRFQAILVVLVILLTAVIIFAMTAAWYTNVAQTGGLQFEVEQWGFEGEVTIKDDTVIKASPGEEGIISLTAVSKSDGITAVGVNVSKAQIADAEIHKRLYFYVDTSQTKHGEAMERVYLNSMQNYTYLLFSNGTLQLTETVYNNARLKWHWVYDVLGYYVQGTVVADEEGTWETVTASEYLRPIEYDYDEATTTFETDASGNVVGSVVTVDGTTTLEEFLYNFSLTDGYAGTIGTIDSDGTLTPAKSVGGYYPVSVDENGQGVWAYLCNYSEIETNTEYDTKLAAATDKQQYAVRVTITAQNTDLKMTEIKTLGEFTKAINEGKKYLQLTDNLTLSDNLVLSEGQFLLDLNGKTLSVTPGTYSENGAAIQAAAGCSLTIVNGTVDGDGTGYAIEGTGAEVNLSNVKITDVARALLVRDNSDSNTLSADAKTHLTGCTIETSDVSIFLSGNGDESAQTTQLVVENSTITSTQYGGIVCNGSPDQYGTDIQIINSTVTGLWCGVYHPQNASTLVVSGNSKISGYTGLVLKGGTAKIIDSTILGTGEGVGDKDPTVSLSGFCDTGDGIYIESNYVEYHGYEIALEVRGNSVVTSTSNLALRVYPASSGVSVTVYSGQFSSDVSAYRATGTSYSSDETNGYVVSAVAGETTE